MLRGAAALRAQGNSGRGVLAHGPDREVHRPADRFQCFTGGVPPPDLLIERHPSLPAADPGRPLGSGARKGFGPPRRLRVGGHAGTGGSAAAAPRPGQPSLNRLAQVDQHMPAICDLRRPRRSQPDAAGVFGRAVAGHPRDLWLATQPVRQRLGRAVRQQVQHATAVQVHDDRAIGAPLRRAESSTPTTRGGSGSGSGRRRIKRKTVSALAGMAKC